MFRVFSHSSLKGRASAREEKRKDAPTEQDTPPRRSNYGHLHSPYQPYSPRTTNSVLEERAGEDKRRTSKNLHIAQPIIIQQRTQRRPDLGHHGYWHVARRVRAVAVLWLVLVIINENANTNTNTEMGMDDISQF